MKKTILFSSAYLLLACNSYSNDELFDSLSILDSLKAEPYEVSNNCITSGQYSIEILEPAPIHEKEPEYHHNVFSQPHCKGKVLIKKIGSSFSFAGWSKEYAVFKIDQEADISIRYIVSNLDRISKDYSPGSYSRKFYPVGDPVFKDNYVYYYDAIQGTYDHLDDERGLLPINKEDCPTEQRQQVDSWLKQGAGLGLAQAKVHDLLQREPVKTDQIVCYPAIPIVESPDELDYEVEPDFDYELPTIVVPEPAK